MQAWRILLYTINLVLGPARRRLLLGVFMAGLGYVMFQPAFEGRGEVEQLAALIQFSQTGAIRVAQGTPLPSEIASHDGPWPASWQSEARPGYARWAALPDAPDGAAQGEPSDPLVSPIAAGPKPLTQVVLAPVRLLVSDWSWRAQVQLYRLILWTAAMLGFAVAVEAAVRHGLVNEHGAVIMAAWPFMFPQFFAQMTSVGGDALGLSCAALSCAAFIALSRRNDLSASLALGLTLGLGVWANTLLVTLWMGLAAYLGWRSWRLHTAAALDAEWLVLRVFALSLALLIGTGWLVYALVSADSSEMTAVLSPGFAERLWSTLATFSADGGASAILPGRGWRLISLGLLVVVLARWELNWRVLPPLAQAPAFILPVFTLSALLLGLQGYASGLGDLHMLAAYLGLATALCCRSSALALALVMLGMTGALAQGLFQASVFSGCTVFDPQLGRYGYEGARCVLDLDALGAISAPRLALQALMIGGLSAASAIVTLYRQSAPQREY
ncbi:hypothetical protein [Oceanicaulis sp.]|uniref:hypothetical protein n=1 Tax=Oceanicaulis sp. TaxID=1924941 RepID=UPI003F6E6DCA